MITTAKNILSTRPVSDSLAATALAHNIKLDALSFIETEAIETMEGQPEIAQAAIQLAHVVFTSMNRLGALCSLDEGPVRQWWTGSPGHKTQELLTVVVC